MVLGSASESPSSDGTLLDVHVGDVVVVPSGVAHATHKASSDYTYVGVYPKDAPYWENEYGKTPLTDQHLKLELASVAMPAADPVEGEAGALMRIWNSAKRQAKL